MAKLTAEERRRFAERLGEELAEEGLKSFYACRRILRFLGEIVGMSEGEIEDAISVCQMAYMDRTSRRLYGRE